MNDSLKTSQLEADVVLDPTRLQPVNLDPASFEGIQKGNGVSDDVPSPAPAHPTILSVTPPEAQAYEQVTLDVANASTDSAQYCAKLLARERHECDDVECKVLSIVPLGGQARFTIQVPNLGESPLDCELRVETRGQAPHSGGAVAFRYLPPLVPGITKLDPPSVEPGGWLSMYGTSFRPADTVEFSGIPVQASRGIGGVVVQHGVAVVVAPEVRYHSEQFIEAKVPNYKSTTTFGGYVSVTRTYPDAPNPLVSNYSYLRFWGSESNHKPKDGMQDRLARLEQRCAALTDKLETATRGGAIASEVSALKRGVEEIRALLGALPLSGREDFTCTCGAKGWIAVRVQCTRCGRDSTFGFFPPAAEAHPPREPQQDFPEQEPRQHEPPQYALPQNDPRQYALPQVAPRQHESRQRDPRRSVLGERE